MLIRKTQDEDIEEVLHLFEHARQFMQENGNSNQWINGYPQQQIIEEDIRKGNSYVCLYENKIVGTFYFAIENDPNYFVIENGSWLNNDPYAVIHRITCHGPIKGIASFCINWCFAQYKNIKIDTHKDNLPMDSFLQKNGFTKCGIIHIQNGDERVAYQKQLT